jgi:hypothetical protein
LHAGFQFDRENAAHRDSGNASRYAIYRLSYTPLVNGEGAEREKKTRRASSNGTPNFIGNSYWFLWLESSEHEGRCCPITAPHPCPYAR